MSLLRNAWQHLRTIQRHRHAVMRNCFKAGIPLQGLVHDLSKLSPSEFISGVKYYQGYRSPNEAERESIGYSSAWMHHKGRNRHHFEYWTDYIPATRAVGPVKMPLKYVIEMFCDRYAAGRIYNGKAFTNHHPIDYFLKGKPRRVIHPETSELIERLLQLLADEGEEAVFALTRQMLRQQRLESNAKHPSDRDSDK